MSYTILRVAALLFFLKFAACSPVTAAPVYVRDSSLENRAACNADNVLRALRAHSSSATFYCESLLYYGLSEIAVPATSTAVVVTITETQTLTVYPNGRFLEGLAFPTYVSAYPASRVRSGCSCLLGPSTTITSTIAGSTITSYTITTTTSTLSGLCATDIPYSGAFALSPYDDTTAYVATTATAYDASNAYDCCMACQETAEGFCLAYYAIPGVSCVILEAYIEPGDTCSLGGLIKTSSIYPNNLGGTGPCASTIVVD